MSMLLKVAWQWFYQPDGPAEAVGGGGGVGRSEGGVLTINVKLSSVAGSFEM